MSDKKFLTLPYGYNSYEEIRNDNCYFVDKTSYLKNVLDGSGKVLLFTRPRRFGKTVFMSTLNSFLKINKANPSDTSEQLRLFEGTQILKDTEFCEKYMGKYPVIFITLKSVDGDNFEDAYKMFADTVWEVASEYKYLLNSSKLDEQDKEILSQLTDINYLEDSKNSSRLKKTLTHLSSFLYKEYGKLPALLIDEYDVPLAKASYHDLLKYRDYTGKIDANNTYHSRMVTLMSGFLD
ncbi:MAG: AAA family ATPase, partial [Succinivibrio sp.]|nr:AAA family ATPase [Succinivibrio sp.]